MLANYDWAVKPSWRAAIETEDMIDIHTLARPFEPWNSLYSHSKVISAAVITLHLGSMFIGGGLAVAADRATLRVGAEHADERARQLTEVADVHRPVLIGIALLFVSGIAMALADLENFLASPVFWVKISLVTLLLINGALLQRTESALRADADRGSSVPAQWRRLRTFTLASITLWIATFIAGSILTNAS
ncbi:MAG: hypothetical protein JWM41_4400 [Gemmatimonadetes bacterium]|nr:hypothetical protein [Gemmatimonadota bacterium]